MGTIVPLLGTIKYRLASRMPQDSTALHEIYIQSRPFYYHDVRLTGKVGPV